MNCKYTNLLMDEIEYLNDQYDQMSATDPRAIKILFQITDKQMRLICLLLRAQSKKEQNNESI